MVNSGKITPVIAGLVGGIAFIILFSIAFAYEEVPPLPSKNPVLLLIYEGKEYEGASGSYGWSNGRTVVNVDALIQLPEQLIEIKNGSTIAFVSKDDYITKQPDVFQVIAARTDKNFNNSGFDKGITLTQSKDHRNPDPNNNIFSVELDSGEYILNVHAGWSPEMNKVTGGVDYYFKIRVVN